jgi:hypothetical protein
MNTELERQLRAGMERVPARVPAGLARQAYQRYRQRRRHARIAVAVGTAAVVAGAATAVASASTAGSPQTQQTAYVVSHVSSALTHVSGDLLHTRTTYRPADAMPGWDLTVGWAYGHSMRATDYTPAGTPYWDTGVTAVARPSFAVSAVNVDYAARNFMRITPSTRSWSMNSPVTGPIGPPPVRCSAHLPPGSGSMLMLVTGGASPAHWAAYFRAVLACGQFRVAGQQRVGGTRTIKLVQVPSRQPWYRAETIWVDPSTYRPVVMEYTEGSTVRVHTTFEWLPPTQANLAHLTVPVPAGFTQVTHN